MDQAMAGLARSHVLANHGPARLVAGRTGAFVVVPAGAVDQAGVLAARLALSTRDRLVELLAWAPFIEQVVVVDERDGDPRPGVTVVPRDLLVGLLCDGPSVIGCERLLELCELVLAGSLAPWTAGLGDSDSIDLCEQPTGPAPATPTTLRI